VYSGAAQAGIQQHAVAQWGQAIANTTAAAAAAAAATAAAAAACGVLCGCQAWKGEGQADNISRGQQQGTAAVPAAVSFQRRLGCCCCWWWELSLSSKRIDRLQQCPRSATCISDLLLKLLLLPPLLLPPLLPLLFPPKVLPAQSCPYI
jgi:hypothetical protein